MPGLLLIDLVDAVAEALDRPFADISVEMVFRSLYHAAGPCERGEAASVVAYLAAHAKCLYQSCKQLNQSLNGLGLLSTASCA